MPWPTARNAVPMAAVVFPLPGPVFTMIRPRRRSDIRETRAESLIVRGGKYPCQRHGADWPGEDARRSTINYCDQLLLVGSTVSSVGIGFTVSLLKFSGLNP